jgi:multiple sugar transport system permease protein
MRNRKRTGWHKYINLVTISTLVTVLFIIIPLYWLVATSFKNPNSIGTLDSPAGLGPNPFSTDNYYNAFVNYDFGVYFKTSVIVTLSTTALVLILGTLAGYALGRLPMRAKFTTMVTLLIISVFPAVAVLAPLYLLMREIGWLNSYQALILPYTAFNLPFAIWILRNYMLGIPKEMEETGRIDGAGPLRTVWTIILPMALPGVFTAGIFCFTACWTEFLMALTFNSANNYRTIPVGIAEFGGNFQVPYGTIFAASVVAVVPIGILVFIFRRFVISGLTSGAVKG